LRIVVDVARQVLIVAVHGRLDVDQRSIGRGRINVSVADPCLRDETSFAEGSIGGARLHGELDDLDRYAQIRTNLSDGIAEILEREVRIGAGVAENDVVAAAE